MKIYNKKARFNYFIIETLEAGVALSGPEVKSIRAGRVDLSDGFIRFQNGNPVLKNVFIAPYQSGSGLNYNPKADRKLLLHKNQISSLLGKLSKSSHALIPVSIYDTHNIFKVEVALAASKRKVDKRRAIKEKDEARRLQVELKGNY